jgi:OOP family OmpA-OmpF porin
MYPIKLLLIFSLGISASLSVKAQSKVDYLKAADKYYMEGDYYSAAVYYEKYLGAKKSESKSSYNPFAVKKQGTAGESATPASARKKAIYQLAESYRLLNDYGNAENHFAEVVKNDAEQYPTSLYWYGVSLRANQKPQEAITSFEKFISVSKPGDAYVDNAKKEVDSYKFTQEQTRRKDTVLYTIRKASLNKTGATYAASINNGNIFFTSTRPDTSTSSAKNESAFANKIYYAKYTGDAMSEPEKLAVQSVKGFEQGVATFTPSGNKIFFTRWQKIGKASIASIYSSDKAGIGWSEPVKLSTAVNVEGYNSQQPYVTPDGKYLLYASDMPGTTGKLDLWVASLDASGNVTGSSKNLGTTINTKDDDASPFYHAASKTLVFASNGRIGLGGFDLYTSKGDLNNGWSDVANAGYPVNSVKDDLYFTTTSNEGLLKNALLSSDRFSTCCLDLLTVNKVYKKYVIGKVVDCKTGVALSNANVRIFDTVQNQSLSLQSSDANGNYTLELTDAFRPLKITAQKQGYTASSIQSYTADNNADTLMNAALCLVPDEPVIETPVVPSNPMFAYFDFDKTNLRSDAIIVLDSLAAVLKRVPGLKIEIGGYTDGKGNEPYNLKLSEDRAQACYKYLVNTKGIDAQRISIKSYGECCHVGQEQTNEGQDNPEGRQLNRRAEFKIIGF